MVEVLVLEHEAAHYAAAIGRAIPGVRVHVARDVSDVPPGAAEADVLVALAHEIPDRLVAAMPRLRWLQALTTGIDHLVGLPSLAADVRVTSARGIHGPQMAEMALMYMTALSRNLRGMMANQGAARWERWPQPFLMGKTAVLVSIGAISETVAARCRAFGMRVVGVSDARTEAAALDAVLPRARLVKAAAQADFLIVLVPSEATTRHLVSEAVLAAMQPGAFVINLTRAR